jgi:hypothetical protein
MISIGIKVFGFRFFRVFTNKVFKVSCFRVSRFQGINVSKSPSFKILRLHGFRVSVFQFLIFQSFDIPSFSYGQAFRGFEILDYEFKRFLP